jgi:hypothetical protein
MTGARGNSSHVPTCNLITIPNNYVADTSCSAGAG